VRLRILLSEDNGDGPAPPLPTAVRQPTLEHRSGAPVAGLEDQGSPPLLLYLADEPEIGRRFRYGSALWEIVDYQDGWIARLVVTH
jgi:hypothetical protein